MRSARSPALAGLLVFALMACGRGKPAPTASPSAPPTATAAAASSSATTSSPAAAPSRTPPATTRPEPQPAVSETDWRTLSERADARGDAGSAPNYADLAAVHLDDEGRALRLRIDVAGSVPAKLRAGETVGLAVEFRPGDTQLFVDGGESGWTVYVDRGEPVALPGQVTIEGNVITVHASWAQVGDPQSGTLYAELEWSNGTAEAADRAPDTGSLPFSR